MNKDNNMFDKTIDGMVASDANSTARYFTADSTGKLTGTRETVCYHAMPSACGGNQYLGIIFQGYGGFIDGKRWRAADEADLYTTVRYPFVAAAAGKYNKESLEWLKGILDPNGPFKTLLPLMMESDPEAVQARRAFIFPDISSLPARLTWCFAIASRIGFSNARVLWRYLHLLDKGVDRTTAILIAGGFEHEVRSGEVTGRIIKSYTSGFLGVDVTAYAGRFLGCNPIADKPFSQLASSTYGSSAVFLSGKMDLKKMTFDTWDEVIAYTQERGLEQTAEIAKAA